MDAVPKTEVGWNVVAESAEEAPYRTIGGSTLVPVQVPASIPVGRLKSSVFGTGPSGERLPFASYESSVFGIGQSSCCQLQKFQSPNLKEETMEE